MAAPSESSQTYDVLLNLNSESAKHSQWLVRVVAKRIEQYVYQAKKGQVNAQKLVCVMVGTDPSAYITGSAKDKPRCPGMKETDTKLTTDTVYTMVKPALDRTNAQWIGGPVKVAIILNESTLSKTMSQIPLKDTPAKYVKPRMKLAEIMNITEPRNVDFAGIVTQISDIKDVVAAGRQSRVRDIVVTDDSNHGNGVAEARISVWGDSREMFKNVTDNTGITILNCRARGADGGVRLDAQIGSAVFLFGENPNIEEIRGKLSAMDSAPAGPPARSSVTAAVGTGAAVKADGDAVLVSCAILLAMKGDSNPVAEDTTFQVNNALVEITSETLFTKDQNRLFATCAIRDWSGVARVGFVQSAIYQLFALADAGQQTKFTEEQRSASSPARPALRRVNVRGVVRVQKGEVSILVAELCDSDFKVAPTRAAENLTTFAFGGLCGRGSDGFVVAPVARIGMDNLNGMTVRTDDGKTRPVNRVMVLVQGTSRTLHVVLRGSSSRQMNSKGVKCVLSRDATGDKDSEKSTADVTAYCTEEEVSDYQIHSQYAAVLVSTARLGSDAGDSACGRVLVAEAVWTIMKDDLAETQASLMKESRLALAALTDETMKRELSDFVTPEAKKCRTIHRFPTDTGDASLPAEK
jgi:hypothetical protein